MISLNDVWSLLAPFIGWIVIGAAAFSYLIAQYYQRRVFPRVEYHRKGPNSETYSCLEVGNRVVFTPGSSFSLFGGHKKKESVNAVMQAKPEIKIFGFKTIRLHHVIEGFNETVDIRDLKARNPLTGGALATSEAVMGIAFEQMAKSVPKSKGEWLMMVVAGLMGLGWGILFGYLL